MEIEQLPIETDSNISSVGKESWFNMTGDSKFISAGSRKRTIVDSLINHPEFDPQWYSIQCEDGDVREYKPDGEMPDGAEAIVAVGGKMPVGCITIKSKPRSNNHQSSIVNTKTIDPEAFN